MKKVLSLTLVFALLLCLCGCGSSKKYLREDSYAIGLEALQITDEFLNREIEASEAKQQLEKMKTKAESLTFSADEESEESFNNIMTLDISNICLFISMYDSPYGSVTKKDVQDSRDNLADMLGEKDF